MATYPYLGDITILGFDFPPKGWAACDGQLLSIDQYTELYSLLSTTFGGDGRTNFGLPDLRGRVPIDFGQGLGLTDRTLGKQLGEDTVTLTGDQIPAHTHQLNASTDPATATEPGRQFAGHRRARVRRLPGRYGHRPRKSGTGGGQLRRRQAAQQSAAISDAEFRHRGYRRISAP